MDCCLAGKDCSGYIGRAGVGYFPATEDSYCLGPLSWLLASHSSVVSWSRGLSGHNLLSRAALNLVCTSGLDRSAKAH